MHLKMSSGKWRPFCLRLNVLINCFQINEPGTCDDGMDPPDSCVTSEFYTNCESPYPEAIPREQCYSRSNSYKEFTSIGAEIDNCCQLPPPEQPGQDNSQLEVPYGDSRSQRASSLGGIGIQALESPATHGRVRSVSVSESMR